MAKSSRASVIKRNRANLRSKVFAPEVDARTERLAAKLQEIASQPKKNEHEELNADTDVLRTDNEASAGAAAAEADEDMDVDLKSSSARNDVRRSSRIQKRRRRNRHPVTFRPAPSLPNLSRRK